jgi:Holliday junction resolvase RusA-like endonuclease
MDALTSTRMLWYDDAQVSRVSAVKEWVGDGNDEGVSIAVKRL